MSEVRLTVSVTALHAEVRRRGATVWSATTTIADSDELREALASLPAQAGFPTGARQARVILADGIAQRRTLRDLPPVSAAALREMVSLQQQRFFRRNGHPLVTNAVWLRAARISPGTATAVAVNADWLDAIAEGASQSGLVLRSVTCGITGLVFESEAGRLRRALRAQRRRKLLAVFCALAWSAAIVAHTGRLIALERRLEREFGELRAPADALLRARRDLGAAAAAVEVIERSADRRANVARRLARLVEVLPDSAYLASVVLDQEASGLVAGAAPQAALVLARLDRAGIAASVQLQGEALPDAAGNRERFTIQLQGRGAR